MSQALPPGSGLVDPSGIGPKRANCQVSLKDTRDLTSFSGRSGVADRTELSNIEVDIMVMAFFIIRSFTFRFIVEHTLDLHVPEFSCFHRFTDLLHDLQLHAVRCFTLEKPELFLEFLRVIPLFVLT